VNERAKRGSGPGYEWRCHVCEGDNAADASACAHCGFSSEATPLEIAAARGEPAPYVPNKELSGWWVATILSFFISW
jgi:hypothetical protein